jgi:hypothetical protein
MKRVAMMVALAVLAGCLVSPLVASAQTAAKPHANPKTSGSHVKPMHPDTLTLYPHGRPQKRQPAYSYTPHRFNQRTPVQGTMGGPSM